MLRQYGISEIRKIQDNEKEVNQLLADNWLLLNVYHNDNGTFFYILAKTNPSH